MHFKTKTVKEKPYKYIAKSLRLPDKKVVTIEKRYKNEPKIELEKFFEEKEISANVKYVIKKFGTDHIFTKEAIKKIEKIKYEYNKKILVKLTPKALKDALSRFTANLVYETNALEGHTLTLKDVAIVLFEKKMLKKEGDLEEIYLTRNAREVMELVFKNKFDISHEDIIRMHKIFIKDTEIEPGYRRFPSVITGKIVETTLPEKIESEMTKLIEWYHKNKEKKHPIRLAAIFHGKFEKIHPFEEGNGRIGRFLINLILIKQKYPPLIIRKNQKISYYRALESCDLGHPDRMTRFLLEKFKKTFENFFQIYVKYIK
jgi:Fic family protein